MRSEYLDPGNELQNRIAEPNVYIAYAAVIHWDTGGGEPLRLCSAGVDLTETPSGLVFKGIAMTVSSGNMNLLSGTYELNIPDAIPGTSDLVSDYLINQGKGVACDLHQCYVEDHMSKTLASDACYHLMSGLVTGAPQIQRNHLVKLTLARPVASRLTPIVTVGPDTNNWNTPVGTRIYMGRAYADVVE